MYGCILNTGSFGLSTRLSAATSSIRPCHQFPQIHFFHRTYHPQFEAAPQIMERNRGGMSLITTCDFRLLPLASSMLDIYTASSTPLKISRTKAPKSIHPKVLARTLRPKGSYQEIHQKNACSPLRSFPSFAYSNADMHARKC